MGHDLYDAFMPADTGPAAGLRSFVRPAFARRAPAPFAAALLCAAVVLTAPLAPLGAQTKHHAKAKASSAKATKRKGTTTKAAHTTSKHTKPAPAGTVRPTAAAHPDSVLRAFQVDTVAEPIPETLAPRYPRELRSREVRGSVVAEFVVDTVGRIEPGTFRVISSDDPAFTTAVRDLLPGARFLPAINEGHLVPQIVRQTFLFDVDVLQRPGAKGASGAGTPP